MKRGVIFVTDAFAGDRSPFAAIDKTIGELETNHVIVYLTNGTRDDVWTRRLVESVQRLVLPSP